MKNGEKIWHQGACHCGAVSFEVCAPKNIEIIDCNCSICAKTGYQHLIVEKQDFKLLSGQDDLAQYRFGSRTAKHTFCNTCGIKAFYTPRSHPDGMSVNLRCIDQTGFTKIEFKPFDGQNWEKEISTLR